MNVFILQFALVFFTNQQKENVILKEEKIFRVRNGEPCLQPCFCAGRLQYRISSYSIIIFQLDPKCWVHIEWLWQFPDSSAFGVTTTQDSMNHYSKSLSVIRISLIRFLLVVWYLCVLICLNFEGHTAQRDSRRLQLIRCTIL